MKDIILKNCKELLTMQSNDQNNIIGMKNGESILIEGKFITKIGSYPSIINEVNKNKEYVEIDCRDKVVLPGFIDCHTHLIFGGSRVDEYVDSFYYSPSEIKKRYSRTGLEQSIFLTRNSSDEILIKSSIKKLDRMLRAGTTTVEIKSGYGIDKETEIRLLRLIKKISKEVKQNIFSTYLGAHYYDVKMGKEKYIEFMIKEVMPLIFEEKLAEFSDIWCDDGYYDAKDVYRILNEAKKYGMIPTLHSECYSSIGGAKMAAKLRAANIGHLNYLKENEIILLKDAGVVGVLIPTTDFSVKHSRPFNPKPMLEKGLELAIATNLNPGNWIESMDISIFLACRNHQMPLEGAIKAATLGAAKALRIDDKYGSLEVGKYADIQIRDSETYKNIAYKFGVNEVEHVIKNGELVF